MDQTLFHGIDITLRSSLMMIGCSLLLVIALVLITRDIETRSSRFLGLFLVVFAASYIPQIIGFSGFYNKWPNLTFLPVNNVLLLPGLLYLHTHTLLYEKPIGKRYFYLLPGAIQFMYYLIAFTGFSNYQQKWAFSEAVHNPYVVPFEVISVVVFFAIVFYQIIRMLREYESFLKDNESSVFEFKPRWLKQLIYAFSGIFMVLTAQHLYDVFIQNLSYVNAFPVQLISVFCLAWFGLQAINLIRHNYPKYAHAEASSESVAIENSSEKWLVEGEKLRQRVIEKQWFLEPRINLSQLADRMASNETYISKAVNVGLGQSFSFFINHLRVEHAVQMMGRTQRPLLEIALQSGFNSKASFNRIFKEHKKRTPSGVRKAMKE